MIEPSPAQHGPVVAALDIGGTKLAAALVDSKGSLRQVVQVPTPAVDESACLEAIHELLGPFLRRADAVGVCSAGPFDAAGNPCPVNIPALRGVPLRNELALWSGLPVSLLNDAQALAIAEGTYGAARGVRQHAVVTVSTGVGAGLVVDGRLLEGASGNAGHLGHTVVQPGGPLCGCGRRGCLEAVFSGSAVAARSGQPAQDADTRTVKQAGAALGRALVDLVTLLDLEQVTLAGSVALGWAEPYRAACEQALQATSPFSYVQDTRVRLSTLGVESGLLGAALHAQRALPRRGSALMHATRGPAR